MKKMKSTIKENHNRFFAASAKVTACQKARHEARKEKRFADMHFYAWHQYLARLEIAQLNYVLGLYNGSDKFYYEECTYYGRLIRKQYNTMLKREEG